MKIIPEKLWHVVESLEDIEELLDAGKLVFPVMLFPGLSDGAGGDAEHMRVVSCRQGIRENFQECLAKSPVKTVLCH